MSMRIETKAKKTQERIEGAIQAAKHHNVEAHYWMDDRSVQAELRLVATWHICYQVDLIHFPKQLAPADPEGLWPRMRELEREIIRGRDLQRNSQKRTEKISYKTKTGPDRRRQAEAEFIVETGREFLEALKKATGKRRLEQVRRHIASLQEEQKRLLPKLRAANSAYLSERKQAKAEERRQDQEALESGRFWEASRDALKNYFHPPFEKNYLADVSERWRAALFVECESTAWKAGRGDWRHKLVGTGRGYLCGIDDNGDEWGHLCSVDQGLDEHFNQAIEGTVEEAMAELFGIDLRKISQCIRQGDLLFCPVQIPKNTELHPQDEPWEVRESHTVSAPGGLLRNGRHFRAETEITVSHTSHESVTLPAGAYRLYTLQVADAD